MNTKKEKQDMDIVLEDILNSESIEAAELKCAAYGEDWETWKPVWNIRENFRKARRLTK